MAKLSDWYFMQLVTEADLDTAFTDMQAADQNYVIDNGQVGVYFGLDVAEAGVPNLTVQVSAGAAYDQTGQRIAVPSTQIVNVAVDSNAVSTTVAGVGNSKIISVYAKFKRVLGNPKTDGNNASIQYDRDEGYEFIVRQSTEAVGPTPPALQVDEILLADITRVFGGTTVVNAAISTARRQWSIDATAGAFSVKTGRVDSAIQAVLDVANNHVVDGVGAHAATAISNTPAGTIAATTVQAAINELATDAVAAVAATTVVSDALAAHIADATDAHAASAVTNTAAGNIAATTVQAAINELDSEKGGLATTNSWSGANTFGTGVTTFANGMLVVPTTGPKYIRLRSIAPADATDATLHTLFFRFESTFTSGAGKTVTVIPGADFTNEAQGYLDVAVTFVASGAPLVTTFQRWTVVGTKTGGTFTAQGTSGSTGILNNFAGSLGHVATSVTWSGDGSGGMRLNFDASQNGRVTVSGLLQVSRFD